MKRTTRVITTGLSLKNPTNLRRVGASLRPDLGPARKRIENAFPLLTQHEPKAFQLSLNEAEAVAWQTGIAHLVFPILAEEKARALAGWHVRQRQIRGDAPVVSLAE